MPGTTKKIKLKPSDDDNDDEDISMELDYQSSHFKIDFTIYKVFDNKEYKGKIIDYDAKHLLY